MKTMTCNQLGGACEVEFKGETFEELVEQAKQHGMEMFQKGDEAHLKAIQKMQGMMQNPGEMEKWFNERKQEFDDLP